MIVCWCWLIRLDWFVILIGVVVFILLCVMGLRL